MFRQLLKVIKRWYIDYGIARIGTVTALPRVRPSKTGAKQRAGRRLKNQTGDEILFVFNAGYSRKELLLGGVF